MKGDDLRKLQEVVEIRASQSQTALAKLVEHERQLLVSLEELQANAHADSPKLQTGSIPLQAAISWQAWISERITTINQELALLRAQIEQAKRVARKAYGKEIVAKELLTRLASQDK